MRRTLLVLVALAALPATAHGAVDVRRWAFDAPLTDPPRIRSTPGFVTPQLAAQRTITPVRRLTVRGARVGADDNGYERSNHVQDAAAGDEPPWFVSFRTRSQRLLLPTTGTGAQFRLRVGSRVTPIYRSSADGGRHLIDVRFRDRRDRLITLELAGTFALHSVVTGSDPVRPATDLPRSPVVLFFGDSFTAGVGADAPFASYVQYAARRMGWANAWASGSSFTGYLTQGTVERHNLSQRFNDVEVVKPDVLVIAAGVNDIEHYDQANIEAGAREVFGKARDTVPGARLVVLGPWVTQTPAAPAALATRDTLAAVAREFGAVFVDNVAERWITGSGSALHPTGDGNADRFIAPDGRHLTPAGHRYVGRRLAADLARLLPRP